MATKKKRRSSGRKKKTTRRKASRRKTTTRRRKKTSRKKARARNPIKTVGKYALSRDPSTGHYQRVYKSGPKRGRPMPKNAGGGKRSLTQWEKLARSASKTRRKKKKKASATPRKKTTRKKTTRKKTTRKKTTRRKASKRRSYRKHDRSRGGRYSSSVRSARRAGRRKPVKKSRVVLKAGYPMSRWRKKKYIREGKLSKRGHVNPGRRRRRKKKKNPNIMACFRQLGRGSFWISGAQTVVGLSAAIVVPSFVEQVAAKVGLGRYVQNAGAAGVALTAVSSALAMCAAQYVESWCLSKGPQFMRRACRGLSARVGLGGIVITIMKGLEVFARQAHSYMRLPSVPAPIIRFPGLTAAPVAAPQQLQGMGDWMQLQGMGSMGGATSPESLVAGESFARSVSQFEGMGNMGYRIPMDAVRAPGQALAGHYPGQYGMGDWMQTVASPGSSAAALAMGGSWEPSSVESF
jgi:hypothetical protein